MIDDALYSLQLLVADDASIEDFVCLGGLQVNLPADPGRQGESCVNVVWNKNMKGCNARTRRRARASRAGSQPRAHANKFSGVRRPVALRAVNASPLKGKLRAYAYTSSPASTSPSFSFACGETTEKCGAGVALVAQRFG